MKVLRWSWLGFGLVWVIAIFYFSLMPHPPQPMHFWGADKLQHALTYCLLMLWFSQVYRQRKSRLVLAMVLVAMGISIEYLQGETGYRLFEYADMLANVTGVVVGWVWARTGLGRVFAYLESYIAGKNRQA